MDYKDGQDGNGCESVFAALVEAQVPLISFRFLIEGLMSIVVGLLSFFLMPASITETHQIARGRATWLHGKTGWFTEREEKILVNRILRDDPSKGNMHNRQHVGIRGVWRAVKDYDLWPLYLVSTVLHFPNLLADKAKAWASRLYPVPACC